MKFTLLAIIFSLFFVSITHAGGDDRDQELPLNSLNTEQNINEEGVPRFLQEDEEVIQDKEIEQGQKEIEELMQTKLVNQETNTIPSTKIETDKASILTEKIKVLIRPYIKSEKGILIILILFINRGLSELDVLIY